MSPVVVTKIKVHIPRNFWCSFSLESSTTIGTNVKIIENRQKAKSMQLIIKIKNLNLSELSSSFP